MYNHIFWDFDGTLFDTYPALAGAFHALLLERGFDEPLGDVQARIQVSMRYAVDFYRERFGIDEAFLQAYAERRHVGELAACKPFVGAVEDCKAIAACGKKNYLVTHRGLSTYAFLERYGLADCFADCVTSQDGFARKPSPQAIEHLIRKHSILRDQAIMIGDRDLDLQAGRNAGIACCAFALDGTANPLANYTVRSLRELYSTLDVPEVIVR